MNKTLDSLVTPREGCGEGRIVFKDLIQKAKRNSVLAEIRELTQAVVAGDWTFMEDESW